MVKTPHPTEEVRLKFAEALLAKAEGASPETAALIANAAQGMLGPMITRADDDANLKNKVLEKKAADDEPEEKHRKAPADKGKQDDDEDPTLATVMAALKDFSKRL